MGELFLLSPLQKPGYYLLDAHKQSLTLQVSEKQEREECASPGSLYNYKQAVLFVQLQFSFCLNSIIKQRAIFLPTPGQGTNRKVKHDTE